jgi:hypothetical protein
VALNKIKFFIYVRLLPGLNIVFDPLYSFFQTFSQGDSKAKTFSKLPVKLQKDTIHITLPNIFLFQFFHLWIVCIRAAASPSKLLNPYTSELLLLIY